MKLFTLSKVRKHSLMYKVIYIKVLSASLFLKIKMKLIEDANRYSINALNHNCLTFISKVLKNILALK